MPDLTTGVVLRIVRSLLIWMAALLPATAGQPIRGSDDVSLQDIRAAWERRRESIKSFRYECRLQEGLIKGSRSRMANPLGGQHKKDVPGADVILETVLTFSLAGKKIACTKEGEQWIDQLNAPATREFRATFDTVHNKTLTRGGPLDLGGVATAGKPDDILTVNADTTAFWLAFSPVTWMQQRLYDPDRMAVSQAHAFRGGHACVELSTPRRNPSWRALLYVDPSRECIPLQWIEEYKGVVRTDLSIEYVSDEGVGWRVSAWHQKRFDGSGTLDSSSTCEITRCAINERVADDVFTIEFPTGAHVAEHDGDTAKYYIALGGGKKRYISSSQFGVLPPAVPKGRSWGPFMLAGTGLLAILAIVFFLKRRRERR